MRNTGEQPLPLPPAGAPSPTPAPKKILIVASFEHGRGTGHLLRSALLARDLRALGNEAYLLVRGGKSPDEAAALAGRVFAPGPITPPLFKDEAALFTQKWSCVVFDRFYAPQKEYAALFPHAPVIALDEGGPLRRLADVTLDLLPSLKGRAPANDTRPDLLPLPQKRRPSFPDGEGSGPRVLVCFGGEDAANLGRETAARLAGALPGADITLVQASGAPPAKEDAFRVIPYMPALREEFAGYDIVVTHSGLGAFEAVYARCAVALVSPTRLHERLARKAGFLSGGRGKRGARRLGRYARRAAFFRAAAESTKKLAARYGLERAAASSLAEYIHNMNIYYFRICPVCERDMGTRRNSAARFPEQTFIVCPRCRMIVQQRLAAPPLEYTEAYFFEMYKNQYGKTYLEDFPALIAAAKKRLALIRGVYSAETGAALLDIGCAYGAFLYAAREEGWRVLGIDPSAAAVQYTRRELNIPARAHCIEDTLPDALFPACSFDCVTMWYVIEHLTCVPAALRKVSALLKPGGVFAFSTPSASGISARTSLAAFLKKSPADHWSLWKPAYVRALLDRFGFTVKKIRITGHHPERFPLAGRRAKPGGAMYTALNTVSRLLGLGDTFEVYAVKK